LDPPSSRSARNDRFRIMPTPAPIRIDTKEARNAVVELMASSPQRFGRRAGLFHFSRFANPHIRRAMR
jgi:hypothetical protein